MFELIESVMPFIPSRKSIGPRTENWATSEITFAGTYWEGNRLLMQSVWDLIEM